MIFSSYCFKVTISRFYNSPIFWKAYRGDGVIIKKSVSSSISNCLIDNTNLSGIKILPDCDSIKIYGNTIKNIGNESFAQKKTFIGIDCNAPNSKIENNTITNCGYSGIISGGINNLIRQNFIDNAGMFLDDNAGIYLNNNIGKTNGSIVEENIILNIIGEQRGAPATYSLANGIYLDNGATEVIVRKNSIANVSGSGIYLHAIQGGNKILENTIYNSHWNEIYIDNPISAPRLDIQGNILLSNVKDRYVVQSNSRHHTINEMISSFKENIIINILSPSKDANFLVKSPTTHHPKRYSLLDLPTTLKDILAKKAMSSIKKDSIEFLFNAGSTTKKIKLGSSMYFDIEGKELNREIFLPPYSSKIVIKSRQKSNLTR